MQERSIPNKQSCEDRQNKHWHSRNLPHLVQISHVGSEIGKSRAAPLFTYHKYQTSYGAIAQLQLVPDAALGNYDTSSSA